MPAILTLKVCDVPATDIAMGEVCNCQAFLWQTGRLDIIVAKHRLVHFYQGNIIDMIPAAVLLMLHNSLDVAGLGIRTRLGVLGGTKQDPEIFNL